MKDFRKARYKFEGYCQKCKMFVKMDIFDGDCLWCRKKKKLEETNGLQTS